jgi:hypothetical protein
MSRALKIMLFILSPFLSIWVLIEKHTILSIWRTIMNLSKTSIFNLGRLFGITSLLAISSYSFSGELQPIVDDFSSVETNSLGVARQFLDDKMAGGKTQTAIDISDGKLHIKGEIVPPRGQPGWASSVLLLNNKGLGQDVSNFNGVKLLVKVSKGNISVSANSVEVTNYDYHAAMVAVQSDGKFHEVKIPFTSMKRAWSEQTQLNTATISSLSIVSFGMQPTPFDFEIDQVGFY